jgi:type VI secretion system secreted protein VgrG
MHKQVIAGIEIEDQKIDYYTSVVIRQQFNAHHEFAIRIRYDVMGKVGALNLANAQKLIGKSVSIKLLQASDLEVAYEFRGMIAEVSLDKSDNFTSDVILKGYSPTILLENGNHFLSFNKKKLEEIGRLVADSSYKVNMTPAYKTPIIYICQYKESAFHFMNRLSADFGEWFYYDGKELHFGKPSSSPSADITYGENVSNIQLRLRIVPMTFSNYSYNSKDDKVITANAPDNIDGLGQYASLALKESGKIYSTPVNFPARQRVENKADLDSFLKIRKAALAADLEVLTGSSDNPNLCIGAIANVKFSRLENNSSLKEDYGKFLITGIEHHLTTNGKYYNTFEAIPSGMEVIPVRNIISPVAESQIATVKDNKDPDNQGRVRVQMLWQQGSDMTDWLRVMTPDAGGGKDGAKNRGLVCVPEAGDQVLVCFRYNDPDRPFVLGSMFHGKTGGGGGSGNNGKSLTSKSGHTISLDDGKGISIIDKTGGNKIEIDGTNAITVTSKLKITLTNGTSSLTMNAGVITLTNGKSTLTLDGANASLSAAEVDIEGSASAMIHSAAVGFSAASSGEADMSGKKSTVTGSDEATLTGGKSTVDGDSGATVTSKGSTSIEGAIVKLN